MKIALIGYGRMGRAIDEIAGQRGHEIVARIDVDNLSDFESEAFASADVAIEFTNASQAVANYRRAWSKGIPVVSGTTGQALAEAIAQISPAAEKEGLTLLHSSNFSIGVNLLFALNRYLARIIAPFSEYKASISETHHIHKLDHPSGTAITLADQILAADNRYTEWEDLADAASSEHSVLSINCSREGENPGFHEIKWQSDADCITLSHQAFNRSGFALGSVLAAEWLVKQPKGRFYSIHDMFNF